MRESGRRACVLLGPSPSGLPRGLRRALGVQPGSPRAPAPGQGWGRGPRPHSNPDPRAPPGGQQPYHLSGAAPPAGQRGALRAGGAPRQQPRGERGPAAAPPPPRWPPPRAGGLLGLAGRAEPPCSCPPHCQGPPRAEQGGLCGGAPAGSSAQTSVPRAANWGNLSPGRLHAALGAGGTKAAFQPESPCRAEGPQGPRGHCWPVQPPLPCASCNVDVALRSPPGPGQSRVPLVRPAGVSGLARGWGQLLRPEPCPPLAPGRPSASQGLFPHVRLRQAARAHLPLLGRPLLGEASGQWARGSGQPRRGQGPGEQEGRGPACGVGGLSTASSR